MAQRTVALCDGKYIGIETIYTVINGQQINKPDKLKEVREKSRQNKLFCPCGCGTNLILVAGDRNKREQHFREKPGTGKYECDMPTESDISINSKIILKCWLDDKFKMIDIESRVPISKVEEGKRKPEFTFLSREKKFAIRYWKTRANILDDKLEVLDGNLSEVNVVYIVDKSNGGTNGQYPEALMKIQDRQGFCMLLSIKDTDYTEAFLKVVFYDTDIDGFWKEIDVVEAKLKDFSIIDNKIVYEENTLEQLVFSARAKFVDEQNIKKKRREEQEQRIKENEERRKSELKRLREEELKQKIEKKILKQEGPFIDEKEKNEIREEIRSRIRKFPTTGAKDYLGNRWYQCIKCSKLDYEGVFAEKGGLHGINYGICKECNEGEKEDTYNQLKIEWK